MASSWGVYTCTNSFAHELPRNVRVLGDVGYEVHLECQLPTVFGPDERFDHFIIRLERNGEAVGEDRISPFGSTCSGGDTLQVSGSIDRVDATFDEGDEIGVRVGVFTVAPGEPEPHLYLLVGSAEHPSSITASGLGEVSQEEANEDRGKARGNETREQHDGERDRTAGNETDGTGANRTPQAGTGGNGGFKDARIEGQEIPIPNIAAVAVLFTTLSLLPLRRRDK